MLDTAHQTINILHIEDKPMTQMLVDAFLSKKLDTRIEKQTTVLGAQRYLQIEPYDSVDVIICDWMLPVWDASYLIKDLYSIGKLVIFYTCLDESEVRENVESILGMYPRNFKYVKKGSPDNLSQIYNIIGNRFP